MCHGSHVPLCVPDPAVVSVLTVLMCVTGHTTDVCHESYIQLMCHGSHVPLCVPDPAVVSVLTVLMCVTGHTTDVCHESYN